MMLRRNIILILIVSVFTQFLSGWVSDRNSAAGQENQKKYLYQWTDDRGGVHITDGLGNVPEKYRHKATILEQPRNEPPEQGGQVEKQTTQEQPCPPIQDVVIEPDRNSVWQQRMKDARQRLDDSLSRYDALVQRRKSLLVRDTPPANVAEALRIEGEMKELQKQIDQIRNEIDVVIPEGARRDGVPPGLLRE